MKYKSIVINNNYIPIIKERKQQNRPESILHVTGNLTPQDSSFGNITISKNGARSITVVILKRLIQAIGKFVLPILVSKCIP